MSGSNYKGTGRTVGSRAITQENPVEDMSGQVQHSGSRRTIREGHSIDMTLQDRGRHQNPGISAETTIGQDRPSSSHIGRNQSSGLRIKQTGSIYRGDIEMTESTITQGNSIEGVAFGDIEQEGSDYASKARGSKNTLSQGESLNGVRTAPKLKMAE
ncbi:hypothetical protein AAL_08372 [Moelleriella libera RCEF 2490]|uniref:Uncharacterized protein n=1 Tax=Moelleriella libera RCEF 2490 TaxID=1081109 RepID=A0A167VFL8_9HYPO|nr:hypothetical protein AAL_08372 [Moelleriella libera RCEF 2490]